MSAIECNRGICDVKGCQYPPDCDERAWRERFTLIKKPTVFYIWRNRTGTHVSENGDGLPFKDGCYFARQLLMQETPSRDERRP